MSEKDSVILTGGCLRFLDSGCGEDCPYHDGKDGDCCPHLSGQAEVYALLDRERLIKAWLRPKKFALGCIGCLWPRALAFDEPKHSFLCFCFKITSFLLPLSLLHPSSTSDVTSSSVVRRVYFEGLHHRGQMLVKPVKVILHSVATSSVLFLVLIRQKLELCLGHGGKLTKPNTNLLSIFVFEHKTQKR